MGLFDSFFDMISGGKDQAATDAMNRAVGSWDGLTPPEIKEQELQLEELRRQGMLTPEMIEAINLGPSAMDQVSTDPRLKQAQLSALSKLMEIGEGGGQTLQEKADLARMQTQVGQQERGSREALKQNMAARGMGGSGFELASQLANQQASQDRAAQGGLDIQAQAQARALEALMQGGQLGGQVRSQDFNEQSAKAQAADSISRFNAANRQDVLAKNVGTRNAANQANLTESQRIADANAQMRNNQQQYNKELQQQRFDNQSRIVSGRSGALQTQAGQLGQQAQDRRGFVGGLISAGAGAYGASKVGK